MHITGFVLQIRMWHRSSNTDNAPAQCSAMACIAAHMNCVDHMRLQIRLLRTCRTLDSRWPRFGRQPKGFLQSVEIRLTLLISKYKRK